MTQVVGKRKSRVSPTAVELMTSTSDALPLRYRRLVVAMIRAIIPWDTHFNNCNVTFRYQFSEMENTLPQKSMLQNRRQRKGLFFQGTQHCYGAGGKLFFFLVLSEKKTATVPRIVAWIVGY